MSAHNRREAEVAVVRPAQPRTTLHAVAGATERRLPGAMEVPIEQVSSDPGQPRQDWEESTKKSGVSHRRRRYIASAAGWCSVGAFACAFAAPGWSAPRVYL